MKWHNMKDSVAVVKIMSCPMKHPANDHHRFILNQISTISRPGPLSTPNGNLEA